jgi:hypothetical protein
MERLTEEAQVVLPAVRLPSFRTALAIQDGVQNKIMIRTANGLGDVVCAEPMIRWAIETFKGCEFYVFTNFPQLFSHLDIKQIFSDFENQPKWTDYLCFETIKPTDDIQWEFMSHMIINCVDFPSLCAFRCQIPNKYKQPKLPMAPWTREEKLSGVVLHPGKTWQSRTLPAWWWNDVISHLLGFGICPTIIGKNGGETGTVGIDATQCLDLRDKLSLLELSTLLQMKTRVLLTNDSSPLHIAAAGDAFIGYVSTVKHPDYITHWRNGKYGWRMQNHSRGGLWDIIDYCPNKDQELRADNVDPKLLESWLPNPKDYAQWALERND